MPHAQLGYLAEFFSKKTPKIFENINLTFVQIIQQWSTESEER